MMRWMFNLNKFFGGKSITDKKDNLQSASYEETPHAKAVQEALHHPNGWVYEIDAAFENEIEVPPQAIKGAWKVNSEGIIEGKFIPNPNYHG